MNISYKKIAFSFLALAIVLVSCIKEDVNYAIGTPYEEASIYVIRNIFKGSDVTLSAENMGGARYTTGVVISRYANNNFPEGYIAIQDEWRGQIRGILVKVDNPEQYLFGDSVKIKVSGAKLTRQDGPLTIVGVSSGNIEKTRATVQKEHRPVSIATLEKDLDIYESTLISITADVDPEPSLGETFKGVKTLLDGENKKLDLYTNEGANFAAVKIAPSASFQGILLQNNGKPVLRMQAASDMMYPSGKLYSGWPETFEEPFQAKTSYNIAATQNLLTMPTGVWYMLQCIQGITEGRDRIVSGQQAIRFQQNLASSAYLQMNFDVPDGASKVTFWYGSYYTDRSCTFQLEYSTDGGTTWKKTGDAISDAHSTATSLVAKQAVFLMNITGPVRFRINKLGLGTSNNTVSNGRLGLDDFAIFKSY